MGVGTVKNLTLLKAKQPHVSLSSHVGLFLKSTTPVLYSGFSHIYEPPKFYVVRVTYVLLEYTYQRPKLGEMDFLKKSLK